MFPSPARRQVESRSGLSSSFSQVSTPLISRRRLLKAALLTSPLAHAVYVEHLDDTWDFLGLRIKNISKAAAGDSGKIVCAFHHVLTVDQKKYDAEDVYEIEKTGASVFQDNIDGMVVKQTMAAAAAEGADPFVA
ncbi:hypothetical protein C8R45DRAFT_936242 [Mycena sanguinolenta]|nr:hypothetical protein C8R45DRAFT_936242 [Mycena sanguinolenta]